MDYEQRHPILQEVYEYLKNTPKEQIEEDWSYVFKETYPTESYYKQKYEEALERARTSFSYPDYPGFMRVDVIFPELRENDRIVGCLLNYFNHVRYNGLDLKGTDVDEVITWLEKQGKQQGISALEAWKDMRLEVYQQASGNRHEPNYSDDSTKMFSLNDIDEIIEKISEQKSDDKVEPKFKVGDWIVFNGLILHIDEVVNGYYRTTSRGDGIH